MGDFSKVSHFFISIARAAVIIKMIVVIHKFTCRYAFFSPLLFHKIGNKILYFFRVLYIQNVELGRRFITCTAMYRSKAKQALSKRAVKRQIHHSVQADLLFLFSEKSRFNKELFACQLIYRKAERQTEKRSFSFSP